MREAIDSARKKQSEELKSPTKKNSTAAHLKQLGSSFSNVRLKFEFISVRTQRGAYRGTLTFKSKMYRYVIKNNRLISQENLNCSSVKEKSKEDAAHSFFKTRVKGPHIEYWNF